MRLNRGIGAQPTCLTAGMRWRPALALVLLPLVACGGGSGSGSAACSAARREALDSNLAHVLPGAAQQHYLTDPPTSGPHQPTRDLSGVQDSPIAKPVQVGLLEAGKVIIQHRALPAADEQALAELAGPGVVVAPATELPAPIVATAWLYKQQCDAVDTAALGAFVDAHAGKGPGSDG
jgi:hypothetical protein